MLALQKPSLGILPNLLKGFIAWFAILPRTFITFLPTCSFFGLLLLLDLFVPFFSCATPIPPTLIIFFFVFCWIRSTWRRGQVDAL